MTKNTTQKIAHIYSSDDGHPARSPDGQASDADTPFRAKIESLYALLQQNDTLLEKTTQLVKNNLRLVNNFLNLQMGSLLHEGHDEVPSAAPYTETERDEHRDAEVELRTEVETLRALLRQKDDLLKETNHRVKNSLQLVNSFLYLQSRTIEDEKAVAALQASQRRIRSIALSHELLSLAPDPDRFDVKNYLERLASGLAGAYEDGSSPAIDVRLAVADLPLTVRQAITCGLIINELVSNAFEHAFPADWPAPPDFAGEIVVTLKPAAGDSYVLEVRDNGVGMPSEEEKESERPSLGRVLIESFAGQLGGRGVWQRNESGGTTFRMTAPLVK